MNIPGQDRRMQLRTWAKITGIAFLSSLAALIVATALSIQEDRSVRQATEQQARVSDWMGTLQGVLVCLTDAETAQRGYLLTGNERYLAPYRGAVAAAPALFARLATISVRDPAATSSIRDLQRQGRLKLAELSESLRLHDEGNSPGALHLVQTDLGQHYMEQARADLAQALSFLRTSQEAITDQIVSGSLLSQRFELAAGAALLISVTLAALQMGTWWVAQKRYEQALAESEQRHRAIVEDQTELICLSKADGTLIYFNPAFERLFGVSSGTPHSVNVIDSTLPSERVALQEQLVTVLETGQPILRESRLLRPDGESQWIAWRHRRQLAPDGVALVHSVGREITQRKKAELALRDLTDVFDATTDYVAQTDRFGHLQYLNPAARRVVGISADESITGRSFTEFYTSETNIRFISEIIPSVRAQGVWLGESHILLPDERIAPVSHMVIAHRDPLGKLTRFTSIMRNISTELEARQELAKQTATLNAIVEEIPAMVAVWDTDLRYRLVNRAFERWRGQSRETFIGRTVREVISSAEHERSLPWMERALRGETVTYEKDYTDANTRHVSVTYIPLRLADGSIGGFIGVAQDITHHREEQARLLELSEHDPLTGLLNRSGFEHYVRERSEQGRGSLLAVLYIDVDHFKPINDRYGHAAGDQVLKAFACRLRGAVRPSDAVARLGGDEFGIVLSEIRESRHAALVAEKIVQVARQPFEISGEPLNISASIGVAFDAEDDGGWQGLLARADSMAYQAKAAGRGCYRLAADRSHTARLRSMQS